MRGLGDKRSLLRIDGRRLVTDDLNTVPSIMVENVDIVTGGASAAWGSDAVGGVVNLIIDGDYEGIRLGAEAGISRSEEHTSELQSLMRISYAVFCLKKKNTTKNSHSTRHKHPDI